MMSTDRYANTPIVESKPPVPLRAGSRLGELKYPVYGPGRAGGPRQHGMIDPVIGVYQGGGEKDNFIYRRLQLVSLALPVWQQIAQKVLLVEMIDHVTNRCYSLSTRALRRFGGRHYTDGIGPRIGWPVSLWRITERDGTIVQLGAAGFDPTHPGDLAVQLSLWEAPGGTHP